MSNNLCRNITPAEPSTERDRLERSLRIVQITAARVGRSALSIQSANDALRRSLQAREQSLRLLAPESD